MEAAKIYYPYVIFCQERNVNILFYNCKCVLLHMEKESKKRVVVFSRHFRIDNTCTYDIILNK